MHDFLVGDDGFGYENPGPVQFSQPSPVQEIVAPAWQLQLVSRAWDDAEIDRRIAEAQRLCGIPWEPGRKLPGLPVTCHYRKVREFSARRHCRAGAGGCGPVCGREPSGGFRPIIDRHACLASGRSASN